MFAPDMSYPVVPPPPSTSLLNLALRIRGAIQSEIGLLGAAKLASPAPRLPPSLASPRTSALLLKTAGLKMGPGSIFLGALRLTGRGDPRTLFSMGANTIITGPLHVDLEAEVRIGDRVNIGHDVALL